MKEQFEEFLLEGSLISHPEYLLDNFVELFFSSEITFVKTLNNKTKGQFKDGFPYRTLNYWEQIGIIDDDREKDGKWRNYSMLDQIWLEIVIRLRNLGISMEVIHKIKNYSSRFGDITQSQFPFIALFQAISISNQYDPYYLIFNSDGECQYTLRTHLATELIKGRLKDFTAIDVSEIMREVTNIQKGLNKIDEQQVKLIQGNDVEIHREISDLDNLTVTVRKDAKGNPSLLEIEKKVKSDGSKRAKIEFGEITKKVANGKIVSETTIIKKKIQ